MIKCTTLTPIVSGSKTLVDALGIEPRTFRTITKPSITKTLLNIVSHSLEQTDLEIPEDKFYSHTYSPPPSPPLYLNPHPTPCSTTHFESYRPRDKLSSFKLSNMSTSTDRETRSKSKKALLSSSQQEARRLDDLVAPGILPSDSPLPPSNDPNLSFIEEEEEPHLADTSFALEVDQVNQMPTDWTFDGPLLTGPSPKVFVALGTPLKDFPTAGRRRDVRLDTQLSSRRDALLSIAEKGFDRAHAPGSRPLTRYAMNYFREELLLLHAVLLGHPARISEHGSIGYYIDPYKYKKLLEVLERIACEKKGLMQSLELSPPKIPTLPSEWPSDSLWSSKDLEVLCVTLQEDVENFLALYWDAVGKYNGTWRLSKDDFVSPPHPEFSEMDSDRVGFEIRFEAAQAALQRKRKADANFYSAIAVVPRKDLPFEYEAPLETRPVRNVSESAVGYVSRDTPTTQRAEQGYNQPIDHDQLRRRQSAMYSYAPSTSMPFESPYRQDPRRLTGSSGLRDLFHTPRNVSIRTASAMPEPIRASDRSHGASGGGAPPPGGDPPDDDGSPGPPHSPSPQLPRPQLPRPTGRGNPPPGFPGGTGPPDGGDGGGGSGGPDRTPDRGDDHNIPNPGLDSSTNSNRLEAYFDTKLRTDSVPEWDGDPDTLSHWIAKINHLAQRSSTVYRQLGQIIPLRLRKNAEKWFFSLPLSIRDKATVNWDAVRETICVYYMNRAWMDRQKTRATRAYYREPGHFSETPSEYYVRKAELLLLVYGLSDSELILEVMNGAPAFWHTVIDAHRCASAVEFQTAIKYHEESLLRSPFSSEDGMERRIKNLENALQSKNRFDSSKPYRDARAHLVGWSSKQSPPKFPRDDSNVSEKPTPESKGARPCRHCGSGRHWDNECKHSKSASRSANTHYAASDEESNADLAYEDLYLEALQESDNESDSNNAHVNNVTSAMDINPEGPVLDQQDSNSRVEAHCQLAKPVMSLLENMSRLGGLQPKESNPSLPGLPGTFTPKNHRERRKSMKDSKRNGSFLRNSRLTSWAPKSLIKLKKLMSSPAGCAFLGSSATTTNVWLGEYGKNRATLVADSGSDITLISHKTLSSMGNPPKIKMGQKVNLIQVTGASKISGYVTLPIFFDSDAGPVQIEVEAYVVEGMTTPVILGNDFAEQYSISLIREESDSFLMFGNTGRKSKIENSVNSPLQDEKGNAFKIRAWPNLTPRTSKFKAPDRIKKSNAPLVWTRTFQNVNRRLLVKEPTFTSYPELEISHRASRVHSKHRPYFESWRPHPSF